MEFKKIIIGLLVIGLLAVGGCETQSNSANNNQIGVNSFRGGGDALKVEFEPNMPPDKVRDQGLQVFAIRLKISNEGETDIPGGKAVVKLSGFEPSEFNISPEDVSKVLPAINGYKKQGENEIRGGVRYVLFSNLKYVNDITAGTLNRQIFAFLCYPYSTKSIGIFCVKPSTIPAIDEKDEICKIEGDKMISNSGAPVRIENLKEYAYGDHSVQIQFDIVKSSSSENLNIYEPGSLNGSCEVNGNEIGSVEAEVYKNKVKYIVDTGIPGLDCEGLGSNSNVVTLSGDRYTVTCVQDTTNQAERDAPLKISLYYDVVDRINKVITIEHIAR